jgi:hypothetical protein
MMNFHYSKAQERKARLFINSGYQMEGGNPVAKVFFRLK